VQETRTYTLAYHRNDIVDVVAVVGVVIVYCVVVVTVGICGVDGGYDYVADGGVGVVFIVVGRFVVRMSSWCCCGRCKLCC